MAESYAGMAEAALDDRRIVQSAGDRAMLRATLASAHATMAVVAIELRSGR